MIESFADSFVLHICHVRRNIDQRTYRNRVLWRQSCLFKKYEFFLAFIILLFFVIHVYLKNPHVRVPGSVVGESTVLKVISLIPPPAQVSGISDFDEDNVNSLPDTLRLHPHTLTSLERQLSSLPVFITAACLLSVLLNHGTAVKSRKILLQFSVTKNKFHDVVLLNYYEKTLIE